MHLHFERTGNTVRSDCTLLSLTWMGKVPDDSPSEGSVEDGWTLNRGNYYQEGWLASGNTRGIVGVTYTTAHTKKPPENIPLRTNYNLRGHRAEITLVRWNEPYQKLASCDSTGIIFVWIKYEGRWSIELINDRNTQVTDFAWSHNGRMALICYQDGFVLVGSVAGQRYWSSMLNLDCTISCGLWTPDDQSVYFGTTDGQIIVMDIHGTMLAQVSIQTDVAITGMAWSCEKFKLEDKDDDAGISTSPSTECSGDNSKSSKALPQRNQQKILKEPFGVQKTAVLAAAFKNGSIYLMKSYDEISPVVIETELKGLMLEWSHSGELLAVAGYTVDSKPGNYINILKFYTNSGCLRYVVPIPNTQFAVSALTWGHNDKRLFLATGNTIHIGWVCRKVAGLQLLSRLAVYKCLSEESQVNHLPIPRRLKSLVHYLFAHTIRCYLPDAQNIRDFASRPPPGGLRLHCTMIRHEEVEVTLASATNIGACYTLYLEYLGGLIPLLKGKRNSKIRPEFIIFDPQSSDSNWSTNPFNGDLHSIKLQFSSISHGQLLSGLSEDSDSDIEDSCTASPRLQRRRRMRRRILREQLFEHEQMRLLEDVAYFDSLPEQEKLVEVTSNIWGTKFKIHGLAKFLPANLGSVTYKTSLLHLQPRQMTLMISELRDGIHADAEPDPNFNPNSFSEDEDDYNNEESFGTASKSSPERLSNIPIAPMTPNKRQMSSGTSKHSNRSFPRNGPKKSSNGFQHLLSLENKHHMLPPALDSVDDEYVNFYPASEFLNSISTDRQTLNLPLKDNSSFHSSSRNLKLLYSDRLNQSKAEDKAKIKHFVPSSYCQDKAVINSTLNGNSLRDDGACQSVSHHLSSETSKKQSDSVISIRPDSSMLEASNACSYLPFSKLGNDKRASKRINESFSLLPSSQWASKNNDLRFIDDDVTDDLSADTSRKHSYKSEFLKSKCRSHSVGGHLNSLDVVSVAAANFSDSNQMDSLHEVKKRLVLSQSLCQKNNASKSKLKNCGKSKSLDSSSAFPCNDSLLARSPKCFQKTRPVWLLDSSVKMDKGLSNGCGKAGWDACNGNSSSDRTASNSSEEDSSNCSHPSTSPLSKSVHFNNKTLSLQSKNAFCKDKILKSERKCSVKDKRKPFKKVQNGQLAESEKFELRPGSTKEKQKSSKVPCAESSLVGGAKSKLSNSSGSSSPKSSRTLSPSCMRKALAGASSSILNSPLLNRRRKHVKSEISDDETIGPSSEEAFSRDFKDLGSLQKAQLKQKLRKGHKKSNSDGLNGYNSPKRRQFTMYNKAPLWNESSQVYQLDFGGRVTQESAKNFQIEFKGQQVMQFGRIDGNAYTLDFQYPFTAIQAFAVALANVTQRLK